MAKHKEGKIEEYFKEQVAAHGGITRKAKWLCRRGCPDQFWAFPYKPWVGGPNPEVGAPRPECNGLAEIKYHAKPDPHQEREIARLRTAGVTVVVVSSFEDVDKFVEKFK
jgi:hypothetical protein